MLISASHSSLPLCHNPVNFDNSFLFCCRRWHFVTMLKRTTAKKNNVPICVSSLNLFAQKISCDIVHSENWNIKWSFSSQRESISWDIYRHVSYILSRVIFYLCSPHFWYSMIFLIYLLPINSSHVVLTSNFLSNDVVLNRGGFTHFGMKL